MKLLRLQFMIVVLAFVLCLSGCAQKKPVLVAPQQLPPTAAPQPTPTPEPTTESQPAEQSQEAQQPAASTDQTTQAAEKTKPKTNHHTAAKKPAAPASTGDVARNTAPKIVIPADKTNAPATPPGGQISPGPSPADAARSQTSTEQLLQSTENNLNSIKRQLSKDEEAMRAQIREFINQSRKATTENDLARAHNFALKARLLSDELAKPQ
ncbi:MAG TPA: hypothetical protein VKU42_09725 [Candidatus Angelobacter sp.]|nr:hypothetical protein [Candidatus Angelobacter sp.]